LYLQTPYAIEGSEELCRQFESIGRLGITVTATGFYGPQGRHVIAAPKKRDFIDQLAALEYEGIAFTNLEMETAGIYGMSKLLGHKAISISAVLANRPDHVFSSRPAEVVKFVSAISTDRPSPLSQRPASFAEIYSMFLFLLPRRTQPYPAS